MLTYFGANLDLPKIEIFMFNRPAQTLKRSCSSQTRTFLKQSIISTMTWVLFYIVSCKDEVSSSSKFPPKSFVTLTTEFEFRAFFKTLKGLCWELFKTFKILQNTGQTR